MGKKKSEKKINNKTNPENESKENTGFEKRKIITDPRFQSLHSDPRFQNVPKHQSKITIDSRFNRMFTDKKFASSSAPVDKRGKPINHNSSANQLRHYYKQNEEDSKKSIESDDDDDDDDVDAEELDAEVLRIAREENLKIDEEEKSDSAPDTDSSSEDDDAIVYTDEESEEEEVVENIPEIEEETRRLAVVNMDWSQIRAVDLYVVLSSFLPRGGQMLSVSVYPSKFGIERMEEEAVKGPVGLFDSDDDNTEQKDDSDDDLAEKKNDSDNDSGGDGDSGDDNSGDDSNGDEDSSGDGDDSNDDGDSSGDGDDSNGGKDNIETDIPEKLRAYQKIRDMSDDENEIDISKLRAYEKSRLRYYFAVVEFDSVGTADHIYRNCDGIEFERSSNMLDLRFIPDTVKFEDPPRDVATERPTNYEAPNFQTDALQNSKIRLTWDEDDPKRKKTLRRKLNDDQLAELELNEYLASDISDNDGAVGYEEDEEEQINKMVEKLKEQRNLLQAGDDSDEENSENDKDMEITFNTGLEDISKRILEKKKNKDSETVWEAHLRRQKEKKKSRKNKSDDDSDSESDQENAHEEPDDFFWEEPSSKKLGKSKNKKSKGKEDEEFEKDQEASRAELELLLADDDQGDENNDVKGYNLKRKKSKGKKGKEVAVDDKIPAAVYDDSRFEALFKNPLYSLDPTDANYKRSAAYARQIARKQHRGVGEETEENSKPNETASPPQEEILSKKIEESKPSKVENFEMSKMVRSLERKSEQHQESSKSNASKKQSNGTLLAKVSSQFLSGKKKKAKISKT